MKRAILFAAVLSLLVTQSAMAGWSTEGPIQQVRVMEGCNTNAGQSIFWIYQNFTQFGIASSKADYESVKATALTAVASRASVQVASTTSATFYVIIPNGVCSAQTVPDLIALMVTAP